MAKQNLPEAPSRDAITRAFKWVSRQKGWYLTSRHVVAVMLVFFVLSCLMVPWEVAIRRDGGPYGNVSSVWAPLFWAPENGTVDLSLLFVVWMLIGVSGGSAAYLVRTKPQVNANGETSSPVLPEILEAPESVESSIASGSSKPEVRVRKVIIAFGWLALAFVGVTLGGILLEMLSSSDLDNPLRTIQPGSSTLSPQQIAQMAFGSTVILVTEDASGQPLARGSGFLVGDGEIVSNLHVAEGGVTGYAKFIGNEKEYNIEHMAAVDPERDLVVLKISTSHHQTLVLGNSDTVKVGDTVYVVGNPKGLEGTFSHGIISGIRRGAGHDLLQITAPISPGSSGEPVINEKGEIIGVSVGGYEDGQNLNFAIPSNYLKTLLSLPDSEKFSGVEAYFGIHNDQETTDFDRDEYLKQGRAEVPNVQETTDFDPDEYLRQRRAEALKAQRQAQYEQEWRRELNARIERNKEAARKQGQAFNQQLQDRYNAQAAQGRALLRHQQSEVERIKRWPRPIRTQP